MSVDSQRTLFGQVVLEGMCCSYCLAEPREKTESERGVLNELIKLIKPFILKLCTLWHSIQTTFARKCFDLFIYLMSVLRKLKY